MSQKQLELVSALQEPFFTQRKELETQGLLHPSVGWQVTTESIGLRPEDSEAGESALVKPSCTALRPECFCAVSF